MTGRYFDPDEIHRKVILTADQHDLLVRLLKEELESLESWTEDAIREKRQLLADVENAYDELAPSDDELRTP
jgi:hypothetical protein